MAERRQLALAGAAAAIGAAGAAGAGTLVQRRHMRRVASDPQRAILEEPLGGSPFNARSADGTELYGETFGADGSQTLVLVHGWTEALRYWTYQIRALSDQFRVVAYDLRGHGRSGRAAGGDYSIGRFGEDVEAVLAATVPDGQRAVVAGHSLGGMSIVAWAEHHDVSARASAAALLFTGIGGLLGDHLLIHVPRFAHALNEATRPPRISRLTGAAAAFLDPRLGRRDPLRGLRSGRHPGAGGLLRADAAWPACPTYAPTPAWRCPEMELHHALPRMTLPTLVMDGERDRLTPPSHARRIASELPHLQRLIELPDTGHMGPLERPDEVSAALRALASEVSDERLTAAV